MLLLTVQNVRLFSSVEIPPKPDIEDADGTPAWIVLVCFGYVFNNTVGQAKCLSYLHNAIQYTLYSLQNCKQVVCSCNDKEFSFIMLF